MKKRRIGVFLICLLLIMQTVTVYAGQTYSDKYLYYEKKDGAVIITGYCGKEKEVTIPAAIAGDPVSTIAAGAFTGTSVEVIYLPDTITAIEENAIGGGVQVVFDDEKLNLSDGSVESKDDQMANIGEQDKPGKTSGGKGEITAVNETSDNSGAQTPLASESDEALVTEAEDRLTEDDLKLAETVQAEDMLTEDDLKSAEMEQAEDNKNNINIDGKEPTDEQTDSETQKGVSLAALIGIPMAAAAILIIVLCYKKNKTKEGKKGDEEF